MSLNKLIEIRENKNLSQRAMANELNVSKSTYARWETLEQYIPLTKLNTICNKYNISMDYLMGLSKQNKKYPIVKELDKKLIGSNLKKIRKDNNVNQEYIANIFNTTHSTISAYENGKTLILTIFLVEFCKQFNVSMDEICKTKL